MHFHEICSLLQCLLSYTKAGNNERLSKRKLGILLGVGLILALGFGLVVGFCPTSSPSFIPYFPLSPYLPTSVRGFFSFVAFQAALQLSIISLSYILVCSSVETFTLCWDTLPRSGVLSSFIPLPVSTEISWFPLRWLT